MEIEMEKILVLGTGGGLTRKCYNTCFILQNNEQYLLVDTGAGAQILNQIQNVNVNLNDIHDIFISHKHIDHLLGIFPLVRVICQDIAKNKFAGKVNVYCAKEVRKIVENFILDTFHEKHIELYHENVIFHDIQDGEEYNVIGYNIKILDTHPTEKMAQFGFQTKLANGKVFTFLGDVPCHEKITIKFKTQIGFAMKYFVWKARKNFFIRIKSTIPQ